MFTRSEAAVLCGMSESYFRTLLARKQLPTVVDADEQRMGDVVEGAGRKWTRFSASDVVSIAAAYELMCVIGYADGLGPETASKIVNNAGAAFEGGGPDIWIGYVGHPASLNPPRGAKGKAELLGGFNVSGTLAEISDLVEKTSNREAYEGQHKPSRMFLVNMSEVARKVRLRASINGMTFGPEVR